MQLLNFNLLNVLCFSYLNKKNYSSFKTKMLPQHSLIIIIFLKQERRWFTVNFKILFYHLQEVDLMNYIIKKKKNIYQISKK